MLNLTVIVAYVLACIVALALGARWVLKNDPLLKQPGTRPQADDHSTLTH